MKKKAAILLTLLLICVIPAFAAESLPESTEEVIETPEEICTYIDKIDEFGNLELGVSATDLYNLGFDMGDIITVSMNDKKYDMPLVSNYSDVDPGSMMCRLAINDNKKKNRVVLGINMGELASWSGIAVREDTDNETGYRWIISEGIPDTVPVSIILKEAKGYIRQLSLHKLVKSDNRDEPISGKS